MRVETNWKLVRRNRRLANFLFLFSMAVLIGAFFIANSQLMSPTISEEGPVLDWTILLSWLVVPFAFISALISIRMTNLWMRRPRPEDAIREGLKGVSKRSILYNYYHFPARHVLITPHGIFAIITRYQDGYFKVEGGQWSSPGGLMKRISRLFRRDDIGNPTEEALRAAAHVKKQVEPFASSVEVHPLIIFVDPRVQLEIVAPSVPVLFADSKREPNLNDYMRDYTRQQAPQENTNVKKKSKSKSQKVQAEENSAILSPEELAADFEAETLPPNR